MIGIEKNCRNCGNLLTGRTDKRYCDLKCKSKHQYLASKLSPKRFFDKVDFQLRYNRKLLKEHFEKGRRAIASCEVRDMGFDRKYFTHYYRKANGDIFICVYEYGYLEKKNADAEEYHLVSLKDFEK